MLGINMYSLNAY
jgi:hypothetical protein